MDVAEHGPTRSMNSMTPLPHSTHSPRAPSTAEGTLYPDGEAVGYPVVVLVAAVGRAVGHGATSPLGQGVPRRVAASGPSLSAPCGGAAWSPLGRPSDLARGR